MQRRLIVMRHAKSAWDTGAGSDHERPLNKRGRRDAVRIAAELSALGWRPERVLSSDAARTRETWALMQPELGGEASFSRDLYLAGIPAVRRALAHVADTVATVMVLGHNPGWEEVVATLSGEDVGLTTANAALLHLTAGTWEEAGAMDGCWDLVRVLRPREL